MCFIYVTSVYISVNSVLTLELPRAITALLVLSHSFVLKVVARVFGSRLTL